MSYPDYPYRRQTTQERKRERANRRKEERRERRLSIETNEETFNEGESTEEPTTGPSNTNQYRDPLAFLAYNPISPLQNTPILNLPVTMAQQFDYVALQNAIAQGFALGAQQAPQPQANNRSKSSVNKPTEFNGDTNRYDDFRRQTDLYILANDRQFPDDQDKILFVTSYMTQRTANAWAQNFFDMKTQATPAGQQINLGTWVDFTAALDATFKDPNRERNAQEKLLSYTQGNRNAEEFFTEFDILKRKAGYGTGYDAFLIGLLERALNPELVVAVYTGAPPVTYEDWKTRAIEKDGLRRRLRDIQRHTNRQIPVQGQTPRNNWVPNRQNHNAGGQQQRPNNQYRGNQNQRQARPPQPQRMVMPQGGPNHQPQPHNNQRTGQTFGGQGQPMEIDRQRRTNNTCNRCGRSGHWANRCSARTREDGTPI